MNIVFVVDHYNSKTDGTIMSARRFEEELVRQGHTVRIVSYGVEGENKFGLKEHYIPIVSEVSRKFSLNFAKYEKKVLLKAFEGADLVHLYLPFQVQRRALRLAQKLGIPVTAAFHLHPENMTKNVGIKNCPKFLSKFIFWYWRKKLYDKVDYIHCPSDYIAAQLKLHKYKAELCVVTNGVVSQFKPKPDGEKVQKQPDDKFNILMVGRLAAEKRQDLLIKAVASSKYKDNINLCFAGGGPLKNKYIKMSESLGLKPDFEFLSQERLLEKIHSSDLYIHGADVEIEGISCIEAFSCGLVPIIGNAEKSATKKFIIDPRCGFNAGDFEELRDRLEYFYEHRDELYKVSLKYIEYAKNFSIENSVKKCVEMFEKAIAKTKKEDKAYSYKEKREKKAA